MNNDKLDLLVDVIGNAESRNKPLSTQEEIGSLLGIRQSAVSKLLRQANKKIVHEGKYYRLSSTLQREIHKKNLVTIFSELTGDVIDISPNTLAVKIDQLRYTNIRDEVKGFFEAHCFGTFCAEDMMIVILQSSCEKELIEEFRTIVRGETKST